MWLTDLDEIARRTGYPVKKVKGWKNRGHGGMSGVRTIVCHHTAGPRTGNMPSLGVVTYGRAGLPGPLCNLALGRDGTIYVVAAGRAYHAGVVRHWSYANSYAIGIEAEEDGVSGWAKVQMDAYASLCNELRKAYGRGVGRVLGHKEICSPPGRKIDPNFNMSNFRDRVKNATGPSEEEDFDVEMEYYTIRPAKFRSEGSPNMNGPQHLEFDRGKDETVWWLGVVSSGEKGQPFHVTLHLVFDNDDLAVDSIVHGRVIWTVHNQDGSQHADYGASPLTLSRWAHNDPQSLPGRVAVVANSGRVYGPERYLRASLELSRGVRLESGQARVSLFNEK